MFLPTAEKIAAHRGYEQFNPFKISPWPISLSEQAQEGYFGITSTYARTKEIDRKIIPSIRRIRAIQDEHKTQIGRRAKVYLDTPSGELSWHAAGIHSARQELQELGEERKRHKVPPGGKEEQKWAESAVAHMAIAFEEYKHKLGDSTFQIRDNQLQYMMLMLLNKGKYDFGSFEMENRGVQMHTGEGKTICNGLIAGLYAIQGEKTVIVEQNYVSAKIHAEEMAGFYKDYLKIDTGIVIDQSRQNSKIVYQDDSRTPVVRKSYIISDQEKESKRADAWGCSIVYADKNSLGFDYLDNNQVGKKSPSGQPDLKERIGLIQEADNQLVVEGFSPWVVSEAFRGDQAWDVIASQLFSKTPQTIEQKVDSRLKAQSIVMSVWDTLYQIQSHLKEGEGNEFYLDKSGTVILSDRVYLFLRDALVKSNSALVGENLFVNNKKAKNFIDSHIGQNLIKISLEILLGHKVNEQYIEGFRPTLVDESGFPLDRRQMNGLYDVFLQLKNKWDTASKKEKSHMISEDAFETIRKETSIDMQISITKDRVSPSVLYKQFKRTMYTSGSLIPQSQIMGDIYDAEVVGVGRHKSIEEPHKRSEGFSTQCLDGGIASVSFTSEEDSFSLLASKANKIQRKGRVGLFILSTPDEAYEFADYLKRKSIEKAHKWRKKRKKLNPENNFQLDKIRIVTAVEELANRGSLEKAMLGCEEGTLVITTQMAHRDFELKVAPEVYTHGGPEVFVKGASSEMEFWQSLQRVLRGDLPGKRHAIITESDAEELRNIHLASSAPLPSLLYSKKQAHEERKKSIDELWSKSLEGDHKSQEQLFSHYLDNLRAREKDRTTSLLYDLIKDQGLPKWKEQLKAKMVDSPAFIHRAAELEKELVDRNALENTSIIRKPFQPPVFVPYNQDKLVPTDADLWKAQHSQEFEAVEGPFGLVRAQAKIPESLNRRGIIFRYGRKPKILKIPKPEAVVKEKVSKDFAAIVYNQLYSELLSFIDSSYSVFQMRYDIKQQSHHITEFRDQWLNFVHDAIRDIQLDERIISILERENIMMNARSESITETPLVKKQNGFT